MGDVNGDTLVLGVGNILWADEGFGVRALERLATRIRLPVGVRLLDGGTQGLALIPDIAASRRLLLFDAVDFREKPGTLALVRDDAIARFVGAHAVSLHQTGVSDVLALARLSGWAPVAVTLIGVQPAVLEDYGGSLSDVVRDRLEAAVRMACIELAAWGFAVATAAEPVTDDLIAPALTMAAYEAGRPSADTACRIGDERVLGGW